MKIKKDEVTFNREEMEEIISNLSKFDLDYSFLMLDLALQSNYEIVEEIAEIEKPIEKIWSLLDPLLDEFDS